MNHCPYQDKDCLIPPCSVTAHPDNARVEYCRVCRVQWEIDSAGDGPANEILPLLATLIALILGMSLLNNPKPPTSPISPAPRSEQIDLR